MLFQDPSGLQMSAFISSYFSSVSCTAIVIPNSRKEYEGLVLASSHEEKKNQPSKMSYSQCEFTE